MSLAQLVSRGRGLVVACAVASLVLVGAYIALGGGRYEPLASADPCQTRAWRDPEGTVKVAEQVVLSSLDGAACAMGVTREELTLALASEGDLDRFRVRQGLSREQLDELLRRGLMRAVEDGQKAGAINGVEGFVLRRTVERLPVQDVIEAYRSGRLDWLLRMIG